MKINDMNSTNRYKCSFCQDIGIIYTADGKVAPCSKCDTYKIRQQKSLAEADRMDSNLPPYYRRITLDELIKISSPQGDEIATLVSKIRKLLKERDVFNNNCGIGVILEGDILTTRLIALGIYNEFQTSGVPCLYKYAPIIENGEINQRDAVLIPVLIIDSIDAKIKNKAFVLANILNSRSFYMRWTVLTCALIKNISHDILSEINKESLYWRKLAVNTKPNIYKEILGLAE